jgi:glycosyltransferase involved in cell wall biosynthesis
VGSVDIVLVKSNPVSIDPRALKIARSLSKKYRVAVLGWDRTLSHQNDSDIAGTAFSRSLRVKAPYGKITLLIYYPLFWIWVFAYLAALRPRVVHACDFDTLIPSFLFRACFRSKLIFDSFDRYAMAFIPSSSGLLFGIVDSFEALVASKCDALVTVSEQRLHTFQRRPEIVAVTMNCPEDKYANFEKNLGPRLRDGLLLVYASAMAQDRGLRILDEAIRGCENVDLLLAGRIIDNSIEPLRRNPRITYLGLLEYSKALELQADADVIPLLYDPAIPINRVANPNKLFEAMMLGVPVISNVCREIIDDVGCGIFVSYDSDDVRRAIISLRDNPSLRNAMGKRGRIAYERKFNWQLMERKLFELYDILLRSE